MGQFPSAEELKQLSNDELTKQVNQTLELMKQANIHMIDKRNKRQLYLLLENERMRRMLDAEAKALSEMLNPHSSK